MRSILLRHLALPLAIALAVPAVVAAYPTAAWAQPAKKPVPLREQLPLEARGHWDAGIALAGKGEWASAKVSFNAAYEFSKNPRVLYNVAVCEKNIGKYHKALAAIERELKDGKGSLSTEDVNEAETFAKGLLTFVAKVVIDIDQKDAEIYINEEKVKNEDLPGPINASSGVIKVRATKPGFAEASQTLEVAGKGTGNFVLRLKANERTTLVNINALGPQRATVKIDNQEVGQTPYSGKVSVSETPHQITVEAPGYVTGVQPLLVKEGDPINLTLTLAVDVAKGKLIVNTRPEGASIEIDGHTVGATHWEGPVDARIHQVSVKKPGYYTWNYEADVPKNGERSVSASLNEDRNTSFVPWLIGSIVVGSAIIVGVVLLATPPDEKPARGTLNPFVVGTQHRQPFPGFQF